MSAPGVEGWLADLGDARKAVQRPAAEALADAARLDPSIRPRIAALLTSPDARRRWGAAYALARLDPCPEDAIPVLVEALGSNDGDVRWASARILTRVASMDVGTADVLTGLLRAPSSLQRKMALYCLRDVGGSLPGAILVPMLDDHDPAVRLAALAATAVLMPATGETAEALAKRLDDRDAGVRRAAAATLGRLAVRTSGVVAALARAATSDDAGLARAAGQALSRLGAERPSSR